MRRTLGFAHVTAVGAGHGGFQGARGNDNGGDWFIENVFEELDNPGEFFFDADAGELYLYHNGTGAPPKSASVVAPQLKVLLNMSGTQWAPVRNVSVTGITYTAAAAISALLPTNGPAGGNTQMIVSGVNFRNGDHYTCRFGEIVVGAEPYPGGSLQCYTSKAAQPD